MNKISWNDFKGQWYLFKLKRQIKKTLLRTIERAERELIEKRIPVERQRVIEIGAKLMQDELNRLDNSGTWTISVKGPSND